ncbi:ThuA domain-containing protein [Bacillus solitudinis]|uniref:ThuA domain-containing protein n=1 Tax=Bacillus solitudinis TaxID=2014074 RepID=UPI000C2464C5|nr:ThuA domain-containing protein [Bacillus solitudinis]
MSKRIVALAGDYYHDEALCQEVLGLVTGLMEGVIVEYITTDELVEQLGSKPDAVILFKLNKIHPDISGNKEVWMDDQIAMAISNYVNQGGAWLAWHSGLASYEVASYVNMLRGKFEYHPELSKVTYLSENRNPILNEKVSYEIIDEHYMVSCDAKETNVFLHSTSKDGTSVAGWAHSFGKGRVCCLTPAHQKEGLFHPETINLVKQSLQWCLL